MSPRALLLLLPFAVACTHRVPPAPLAIPATPNATPPTAAARAEDEPPDNAIPPTPSPAASADAENVREAVFRHLFGKNASGAQQSAKVYCLAVEGGKDPSPALLSRFSKVAVPVVAASECTADPRTGVHQKSTGRAGLSFRVNSIQFVKPDMATASGGYYEAGLSASGNTYTVERKPAAWVVTKDVMNWIS